MDSKKLVIKVFPEDKKNPKGTMVGNIEFSQSGNKRILVFSKMESRENSFKDQKNRDSKMIFDFLDK